MGAMDLALGGVQALMYFLEKDKADKETALMRDRSLGDILGFDYDTGKWTGTGLGGEVRSANRSLLANTSQGWADLTNRYQNRETSLLKTFDTYGREERKALRQQYEIAARNADNALNTSGLSRSTVRAGMARGVGRQYGDALGRLEERLRTQRVATGAALSGETLGIRQAGLQANTAARQQALANTMSLSDATNAIITGQQVRYPSYGPFDFFMSKQLAEAAKPPEPSFGEQLLGAFGGAAAYGAGGAVGGLAAAPFTAATYALNPWSNPLGGGGFGSWAPNLPYGAMSMF